MPPAPRRSAKRPTMRFAPVKREETQGATMVFEIRDRLIWQIAQAEDRSKRREQNAVDLAMDALVIFDAIADGEQPDGLSSGYLIKSGVPAAWKEQREQFAKL